MSRSRFPKGSFPGWRTMTAAQRYNARYDAIWDDARRRGAVGRVDLPGQLELPDTEERPAELAKLSAAAPMRPGTAQKPCDIGLFSDTPKQIDLEDLL